MRDLIAPFALTAAAYLAAIANLPTPPPSPAYPIVSVSVTVHTPTPAAALAGETLPDYITRVEAETDTECHQAEATWKAAR